MEMKMDKDDEGQDFVNIMCDGSAIGGVAIQHGRLFVWTTGRQLTMKPDSMQSIVVKL
jgi:hypothetical protein